VQKKEYRDRQTDKATKATKTDAGMKTFCEIEAHMMGVELEWKVLIGLQALNVFDRIYHEKELVSKFGWRSSSIDVLLVVNDYIIPTQQKWRNSKRRETQGVENFLKSIEFVQKQLGKKVLFGVWSSRKHPFDDNEEKLKNFNVVCVSHFENIDGLAKKTIEVVKRELKHIGKCSTTNKWRIE
jgi:hypothetical protein